MRFCDGDGDAVIGGERDCGGVKEVSLSRVVK